MLNKIVLFLLAYFALIIVGFSQNNDSKKLLIYSSGKEEYLMLNIEKILRELTYHDNRNIRVFEKVDYLNRYFKNKKYQEDFREILYFFNQNKKYDWDKEAKVIRDTIESLLLKNNLLLHINIIALDNKLEYQFSLYEIKKISRNNSEFPLIVDIPINTHDFIVNINDQSYKYELEDNVKKVFPLSNQPPTAKIYIKNLFEKYRSLLKFSIDPGLPNFLSNSYNFQPNSFIDIYSYNAILGDTLFLTGKFSDDNDTEESQLKFKWRQVSINGKINVVDTMKAIFETNQKDLIFYATKPGKFKFKFEVSDNVSTSTDSVLINVLPLPKIKNYNYYTKSHYSSLLLHSVSKPEYKNTDTTSSNSFSFRTSGDMPLKIGVAYYRRDRFPKKIFIYEKYRTNLVKSHPGQPCSDFTQYFLNYGENGIIVAKDKKKKVKLNDYRMPEFVEVRCSDSLIFTIPSKLLADEAYEIFFVNSYKCVSNSLFISGKKFASLNRDLPVIINEKKRLFKQNFSSNLVYIKE